MNQKISFGNLTDVGQVRKANEDYYASFDSSLGAIFVVCDGMGGHVGGAIASQTAVLAIKEYYESTQQENTIVSLQEALVLANDAIHKKIAEDESLAGMGTTAVLVLIAKDKLYYAHIGDSRLYGYAAKKLQRITSDHSFVQSLVDGGHITETEAEEHPNKNQITKALGIHDKINPSVCQSPIALTSGMQFLICTDGLTGMVNDETIAGILSETATSPQEKVKALVDLANRNGGTDNITVQLIQVGVLSNNAKSGNLTTRPILKSGRKNKLKPLIILGIVALLMSSIYVGYTFYSKNVGKENVKEEDAKVQNNIEPNSSAKDSTTLNKEEVVEEGEKFDEEKLEKQNDSKDSLRISNLKSQENATIKEGFTSYSYQIKKGENDVEIGKMFHTTWTKLKKADPSYKGKSPKEGEFITVIVKRVIPYEGKEDMEEKVASLKSTKAIYVLIGEEKTILVL